MPARTPQQTKTDRAAGCSGPQRTEARKQAKARALADLNKPLRVRLNLTRH